MKYSIMSRKYFLLHFVNCAFREISIDNDSACMLWWKNCFDQSFQINITTGMLSNIQKTIFFRYPLKYFWYKVCLSFVPDSRIFCSQFQPWPWGIVCSTPWKFPSQCKGENTHRTPRRWFIRRQSTITVLRTSKILW